jgi:hypothetical protein
MNFYLCTLSFKQKNKKRKLSLFSRSAAAKPRNSLLSLLLSFLSSSSREKKKKKLSSFSQPVAKIGKENEELYVSRPIVDYVGIFPTSSDIHTHGQRLSKPVSLSWL